jgi:hypothetical protein
MGGTWAEVGDSGLLRLGWRWLLREIGTIERIVWQLTLSGNHFIFQGIPEGYVFREISLIWETPVIIDLISKEHRTSCTVWLFLY